MWQIIDIKGNIQVLIDMRCIDKLRYCYSTFKTVKVDTCYLIIVWPNRETATLVVTNVK